MSRARDLITGLRRTQASIVHVPYEVVCDIVGREVAEELVKNLVGFSQTAYKPNMASKEAIEKMEMRRPHHLGSFEREDLLSVIDEMALEAGGMDALLKDLEQHVIKSPLQEIREKMGTPVPFTQEDDE